MTKRWTHYASLGPLSGYRTILAGLGMILVAGLEAKGRIGPETAKMLEAMLAGGGLIALRAAITKLLSK